MRLPSKQLLLPFIGFILLAFSVIGLTNLRRTQSILGVKADSAGALVFEQPEKIIANQPFKITIYADSGQERINAVGIYLNFDPQRLQLLTMDTKDSFCQFYPEKKFDNRAGTLSLACGSPHPGVMGKQIMMTLELMPLQVGQSTILTSPSSKILLSNGKGTNILQTMPAVVLPVHAGF